MRRNMFEEEKQKRIKVYNSSDRSSTQYESTK